MDVTAQIVQTTVMIPASNVNRWLLSLRQASISPAEMAKLRQENEFLRNQISAAQLYLETDDDLRRQIGELRALVGLPNYGKQKIPAEIIAYFPFNNRVTISVGQKEGIEPRLPVLTGNGLLGIVNTVGERTSQVTLIAAPTLRLGAIISGQDAIAGILRGETPTRLAMDVVSELDVKAGDVVVTSGVTERIPRGIVIGTINRVEIDRDFGSRRAFILPAADVSDGPEVVVLK
jgi:rod shape-determining protein MreC